MSCTTSYLLRFPFFNSRCICIAVLEQYPTRKGGGVAAVGKGPSPAAWEMPFGLPSLTISAWSDTLDILRGAILGAWYANRNVEEILPLATTVMALVLKTPYSLPEYKIVLAPPSQQGWVWGNLCIVRGYHSLYVNYCDRTEVIPIASRLLKIGEEESYVSDN